MAKPTTQTDMEAYAVAGSSEPTQRGDVQRFVDALYSGVSDGYLAVVMVPVEDGESLWHDLRVQYFAIRNGQAPQMPDLDPRHEWYLVPSVLRTQNRKKEAVLEAGCLWVDFDQPVDVFELDPKPSIVVNSSDGKYHCYWLLDSPLSLVNLEYYNRRLAYAMAGGDHSGWDANQLLRLPVGINAKYEPPFKVHMVLCNPELRYSTDAFNSLPDDPQASLEGPIEAVDVPQPNVTREYLLSTLADILPAKLKAMFERRQADRSKALWWMYHECARLQIPREDCYLLIQGTPNDKFNGLKYNREEGLWRDIVAAYAEAQRGTTDRGILEQMASVRQSKGPKTEQALKLGKLLVDDMARFGLFLNTEHPTQYYYLERESAVLYPVDQRDVLFRKLMLDRYGVNAATQEYGMLFEHVISKCMDDAPTPVHRTVYYDRDANLLYINRFDGRVYRLDGKTVTTLRNGEDGVLFMNPAIAQSFRIKPGSRETWDTAVLGCANLEATPSLPPEQIRHILWTWVVSTFFREVMPIKPILFVHGEAGSGKSAVLKAIMLVLQGEFAGVNDLPSEADGYDNIVGDSDLVCFDNVDSWKPWLPDKLALTATQYSFMRRQLYSNMTILTYRVSAFVGLTARTPKFIRDDTVERLIPIHVVPWSGDLVSEMEVRDRILRQRDQLWGYLIDYLQQMLIYIRDNGMPEFRGDFRQADFARMLMMTGTLDEVPVEPILRHIKLKQNEEAIDEDPLIYCLQVFTSKEGNENRWLTVAELHTILTGMAGGEELYKKCGSPRSLATRLGMNTKFLATAGIGYEKKGSAITKWRFFPQDAGIQR